MGRLLQITTLCFVVAAVSAVPTLTGAPTADADIVAGEYSLEVHAYSGASGVPIENAPVGVPFVLKVGIYHSATGQSCGAPDFGCYNAVQWSVDYEETLIAIPAFTASGARQSGAPSACSTASNNGDRVLLGCIDVFGPNLTYSGNAWNVPAVCLDNGQAPILLRGTTGVTPQTFVKIGSTVQPIHAHEQVGFSCGVTPPKYVLSATGALSVSGQFDVSLNIDPQQNPAYSNVQWKLEWDPAIVSYVGVAPTADALAEFSGCQGPFLGASAVVVGCLMVLSTTSFSGAAFAATFECIEAGQADFNLIQWYGTAPETFVRIGSAIQAVTVTPLTTHCALDIDGDLLPDDYEDAHPCLTVGISDGNMDPDADGLASLAEFNTGTDPCDADTDGDGLEDGEEGSHGTDPLNGDTDLDGLLDGFEAAHACLDPLVVQVDSDPDLDTLTNPQEASAGSDPCDSDSDDDTLDDAFEVAHGLNPSNADTDGDAILDPTELLKGTNAKIANPDPSDPDDDNDGCTDAEELGSNQNFGGQRDPLDRWDYFDVTGEGRVDLTDTLLILEHFGHGVFEPLNPDATDDNLDRDFADPTKLWLSTNSDTGVDLTDALVSLRQFGHDCSGPP